MSEKTAKKTVRLSENNLVDLIDKIVNETVAIKKQEWINENSNKKTTDLEAKIADLAKQFKALSESVKK